MVLKSVLLRNKYFKKRWIYVWAAKVVSIFIIRARKLARKGFRAQNFNKNGGLAKTKRMATTVADKISFCLVSMLL